MIINTFIHWLMNRADNANGQRFRGHTSKNIYKRQNKIQQFLS